MKSFVIRVWTPADEVEAHVHRVRELCGVVETVGSDELTPFRNDDQLLELLRKSLGEYAAGGGEEARC